MGIWERIKGLAKSVGGVFRHRGEAQTEEVLPEQYNIARVATDIGVNKWAATGQWAESVPKAKRYVHSIKYDINAKKLHIKLGRSSVELTWSGIDAGLAKRMFMNADWGKFLHHEGGLWGNHDKG